MISRKTPEIFTDYKIVIKKVDERRHERSLESDYGGIIITPGYWVFLLKDRVYQLKNGDFSVYEGTPRHRRFDIRKENP